MNNPKAEASDFSVCNSKFGGFNFSAMICVHLKLERFLYRIYAVFILTMYNNFLIDAGLYVATSVCKLNAAGVGACGIPRLHR